jgi:hypothetical protein
LIYYTCDVNICVEMDPGTHMVCARFYPLEPGVTPGLGLNLDLGRIVSSPDPGLDLRRSLRLARPWARTDRAAGDTSLPYP